MITLKSSHEIQLMRRAGEITAAARALAGAMVAPGVTTQEIDRAVQRFIKSKGAVPSFLGFHGYPASVCISVNDEVIHGIPGKRVLREGDIVSIDVGAYKDGYHGDCAGTYPCGRISEEARRLIDVTRQSFFEGLKYAREGYRLLCGGKRLLRGAGVCGPRGGFKAPRAPPGAQLRPRRTWPAASAGDDHRGGAYGVRRRLAGS